ncbi:MAG TPA: amidohydrolase family protein, partial [Desulfobacteria bacterium]|nr:amidohydrolase family protein [Desulfobacteria bacterium]
MQLQQKILEEYAQWGVTGVWTKDGDLDITDIYQRILLEDNLPVRVILDHLYTPYSKDDDIEMFAQRANEIAGNPDYDGFLRADGIKIILDLPYHLWMHEAYNANGVPTTGHPLEDMDEVRRQIFEADINGLSVNVLTMGDRAVTEALDVLEDVVAQNPPRVRHHTVEHAEWIKESDLARFDELGV